MTFFKVKKQYDNYRRSDGSILVRNELYTEKQVQKFKIPSECLEKTECKRTETYWMFGARFSNEIGY